jgi:excisionase family DNA binding protein
MTTNEAAELLGLSPKTVRRQIENGAIKAAKRGRDWWVTPAEVERYRKVSLGKRAPKP